MRMPKFRSLPVDSANQTANHGARGLFHFGQTKVCNLRRAARSDKDVGRFAVSVDDRRLAHMKVFHATRNVQHDVQL